MATNVMTRGKMSLQARHLLNLADQGSPGPLVEYLERLAKASWEDEYEGEVIRERYPDATQHIATHASPEFLKAYAIAFPQDRDDIGEAIVESGDADRMVFFATKVLAAPLPEAERHILTSRDAEMMVDYAQQALQGPWEAAEASILDAATRNAAPAMRYACEVKRTRWPELEAILLEDAKEHRCCAPMVEYFKTVKRSVEDGYTAFDNGRWQAAEDALLEAYNRSKDHRSLDLVAIGMYSAGLSERWPEGEKAVTADYRTALEYVALTQTRLPQLEIEIVAREQSTALQLFVGYKNALSGSVQGKFLPSFATLREQQLKAREAEQAVERSLVIQSAIASYARVDRVSASKAALEERGVADIDFGGRDDEVTVGRGFGGHSM